MKSYTSFYKPLVLLGMPIVIGQLGSIVLAFADTLMIGHHSTVELAAALSYLFGIVMGFGLVGVWASFPFGLTTAGLLYLIAFRKRLNYIEREP